MLLESIAAWLVTVFLHLGLMLGLALFLTSRLDVGVARERLWRWALCGALLTASAQSMLGSGPLVWRMPQSVATHATIPVALEMTSILGANFAPGAQDISTEVGGVDRGGAVTTAPSSSWSASRLVGTTLVSMWLLGVLFVGLGQHRARTRFVAGLRRQRLHGHAELRAVVEALHSKSRDKQLVRLSMSKALSSPVVLSNNEICLPARALDEFSPRELKATLAHELAHVLRRDPSWLRIYAALEAWFFFQPLVKRATAALRMEAELACDDWAVGHGADPLGLAHSLARIAAWSPATPVGLTAMVGQESGLVRRVQRLTSVQTASSSKRRATVFSGVLLSGLGIFACAGPGVTRGEVMHEESDLLDSPALLLKIEKDGRLSMDTERYTPPADLPKLREVLSAHSGLDSNAKPGEIPTLRAVIDVADGVRFTQVQAVLEELARARIWRIEFVVEDGRSLAVPLPRDVKNAMASTADSDPRQRVRVVFDDPTPSAESVAAPNSRAFIRLTVGETTPREIRYELDSRGEGSAQMVAVLLARTFETTKLDRIYIDARRGVIFADVVAMIDALHAAGLGEVPILFVGSFDE